MPSHHDRRPHIAAAALLVALLVGCAPGVPAEPSSLPANTEPTTRGAAGSTVSPDAAATEHQVAPEARPSGDTPPSAEPQVAPAADGRPAHDWSVLPPVPDLTGLDTVEASRQMATYFLGLYPYVLSTGDVQMWTQLTHPECGYCHRVLDAVRAGTADRSLEDHPPLELRVTRAIDISEVHHSVDVMAYEPPPSGHAAGATGKRHAIAMVLYVTEGRWQVRAVDVTPVQVLPGNARSARAADLPPDPFDRSLSGGLAGASTAAHYATLALHGAATGDTVGAVGIEDPTCDSCPALAERLASMPDGQRVHPRSNLVVEWAAMTGHGTSQRQMAIEVIETRPPSRRGTPGPTVSWVFSVLVGHTGGAWSVEWVDASRKGRAWDLDQPGDPDAPTAR